MIGVKDSYHPDEFARLALFVRSDDPEVSRIVQNVRRALGRSVSDVLPEELANVVYDVLATQGIHYEYEPYSVTPGQRIRFPKEILTEDPRVATCLDLAALIAACAEVAHAHPLICYFEHHTGGTAHAIVGVWKDPPLTPATIYTDLHAFEFGRNGNVVVLEPLGVTIERKETFSDAKRLAEELFRDDQWRFRFAVDIATARARRRELPPPATGGSGDLRRMGRALTFPETVRRVITRYRWRIASVVGLSVVAAGAAVLDPLMLSTAPPDLSISCLPACARDAGNPRRYVLDLAAGQTQAIVQISIAADSSREVAFTARASVPALTLESGAAPQYEVSGRVRPGSRPLYVDGSAAAVASLSVAIVVSDATAAVITVRSK